MYTDLASSTGLLAPLRSANAKKEPRLRLFALVDPRGIEPLSENSFTGLSSWVVCGLKFPLCVGHRQSTPAGSPFLHDRYKCELPMHVHHSMTLSPWSWSSSGERAVKKPRHCLIRQPVRLYCQRLILRLSLFRDCSARHAYPASKSPSKPLRTRMKDSFIIIYRQAALVKCRLAKQVYSLLLFIMAFVRAQQAPFQGS